MRIVQVETRPYRIPPAVKIEDSIQRIAHSAYARHSTNLNMMMWRIELPSHNIRRRVTSSA